MKTFHHDDLDGQCAASLTKRKYPECKESDFVSMVYEKSFPFELLDDGPCYILDFSLEPTDMETLMNQLNGNVIWIDHHKSAIDKYKDFRYEVPGIRDIKDAGCVLTWKWLFPEQEIPLYVQYVGDRDAWKWELGNNTRFFCEGLEVEDTAPCSETWEAVAFDPGFVMKNGEVVARYKEKSLYDYLKENGFWKDFWGNKCFIANLTIRGNDYVRDIVPDADIWVSFRYGNGCWNISLHSDKVDVSKIAEQYTYNGRKGGGHKGAAGFACEYPPFL